MRIISYFLLLIFTGMLWNGCGSKAPDCFDNRTKEAVYETVKKEVLEKKFGKGVSSGFEFKLDSIVTMGIDKDTGTCSCSAKLTVVHPNKEEELVIPITYKSAKSEKNSFVVSVYGFK